MHQIRPQTWRERLARSGYFFAALLFHIVLFLMVATIIVFQAPTPPVETEFQAVHLAVPPPPPQPPPPSGDAAKTATEIQPVIVPPSTPQHIISNSQNTSFQVDTSKVVANALSHLSVPAPQGAGMTQGGGSAGGLGSGVNTGFFGVKTEGKRIAYLLDYSGSMEGAFRAAMEKQLQKSLSSLPEGTQVILICWAGPAWLYNQTAPQVAKKWKKGSGYDDFANVSGSALEQPKWIDANPDNVVEIMKGIKAQVSAPGGTDWRQPFRYAMQADPPPDTIFFLTDGQIPAATASRALSAISAAMNKANIVPIVNCLWIENSSSKSDEMEKVARTYKGEFRKVSAKSGTP